MVQKSRSEAAEEARGWPRSLQAGPGWAGAEARCCRDDSLGRRELKKREISKEGGEGGRLCERSKSVALSAGPGQIGIIQRGAPSF